MLGKRLFLIFGSISGFYNTFNNRLSNKNIDKKVPKNAKHTKISCSQAHPLIRYIFYRLAHLFGLSEEPFLRHTEGVIDAIVSKINEVIRWPEEHELAIYANEYNTIGR